MPCEIRLRKFFHKIQNAPQISQRESEAPEPTLRAFHISASSPQQSIDTTQTHLRSMSSQKSPFVPRRGPLPDPLEFQQATSSWRNPPKSHRPPCPLVDLSSLEGPPIDDVRGTSPRNDTIPRSQVDHVFPTNARPDLLWKPLPPRPASTEATSLRQQPMSCRSYSHPNRIGPQLRDDTMLTQYSAQRGRPINIEERQPSRLSSAFAGMRSTSTIIPRQTQCPRSQTFDSIVWHESRAQWVVADSSAARSSQSRIYCLPTRLRNATSPALEMHRNDEDEMEDQDPPDYESHGFSLTHIMRYTLGPASRTRTRERENP
ncbi:hypothetical protein N7523_003841 [Penicillium sp. IBT 18751x]|nr:hypothetical protein N7523_003841 [Penicillium sp. IBT 18751x]